MHKNKQQKCHVTFLSEGRCLFWLWEKICVRKIKYTKYFI